MAYNYKQGKFTPRYPEKYIGDVTNIHYRSSWELKFMKVCDTNPSILRWNSEEVIIPYISPVDKRPHRYFVDFTIEIKKIDGTIERKLIEIKPAAQTILPKKPKKQTPKYLEEVMTYAVNMAKWDAAREFASKRGLGFSILTEKELGI